LLLELVCIFIEA